MALFEDTFPPYAPFGSRTLSLTSPPLRGTDVAIVQAVYDLMLTVMNPPSGPMGTPIAVSGVFDEATRQAVANIQRYFGLAADGVVGPNTYFLFGQGVGPHTTFGGPVYGSRTLAPGASGGDVLILQNRLSLFRYASLLGRPPDGDFDPATAAAVLAFKSDAVLNGDTGLLMNPIVGDGAFDATWLYTFAGGRAIHRGRNGFDVVFLQVLLAALGLYGGPVSGYYDAATEIAVRTFQAQQGIAVDGVVGPTTFYRLGLQNPLSSPKPLGIAWPVTPPSPIKVCSSAFVPVSALVSNGYGMAALVTSPASQSLDVTANNMADPSIFGPAFEAYTFTLTDPATGQVAVTEPMTRLASNVNDWSGTAYSGDPAGFVKGRVTVYPSAADGTLGPAALSGDLGTCH